MDRNTPCRLACTVAVIVTETRMIPADDDPTVTKSGSALARVLPPVNGIIIHDSS